METEVVYKLNEKDVQSLVGFVGMKMIIASMTGQEDPITKMVDEVKLYITSMTNKK